jgi:RNA polymerase sigma-70 factor, ECF subfamily
MEPFVSDDDFVRRLRERDPLATEEFHRYFRELLLFKLRRRLRSLDAIDEVRQEVFTRCYEHLAELRDARKLGAFVNAICNRVLMEYYRAEGRTTAVDELPDVADSADVEVTYESARNAARVRRVLESLPERDAQVLRAVFLEEADKDEVCQRFGVDRQYLRVLLHRAKKAFRTQYLRRKSGQMSAFETFGERASLRQ